jgi:hypothetical protein
MADTNTGVGPGQDVESRSGLLGLSLSANGVLAIVAIGLAVWGWRQHQQVIKLDKEVAAANEERDDAYQTSRDLQYALIKAKGELKGFSETLQPQSAAEDQETDTAR